MVKDGRLNFNYGRDFEAWFNDHFNQRKLFIDVNSRLNLFLNRKLKSETAMAGKDGWMYTKRWGSVEMFQNKYLYNYEDLRKIKNKLERISLWAKRHGMKFYVFLVPDKERIYPEFYPDGFKKINPAAKIEQVEEYMRAKSFVPVIYPEESLMAAKKDHILYYKTGTHWNHWGAYIGYLDLFRRIKKDFPSLKIMQESYTPLSEPRFEGYYGKVSQLYDGLRQMQQKLPARAAAGESIDTLAEETWALLCAIH